jgi:hypothetical protein
VVSVGEFFDGGPLAELVPQVRVLAPDADVATDDAGDLSDPLNVLVGSIRWQRNNRIRIGVVYTHWLIIHFVVVMTPGQIALALLIYVIGAMFAGKIASDKGRSAPGLILLSLILSPLLGIAVALILQPGDQ